MTDSEKIKAYLCDVYDFECPGCGEAVQFITPTNYDAKTETVTCPHCNVKFDIVWTEGKDD